MIGLDEFIALVGKVTIADGVMVILAVVFGVLCYKKVSKYFEDKALAAEKKEKDEKAMRADVKKCLEETAKYPQYRDQSLKIQHNLEDSIRNLAITVDENEVKRLRGEVLSFGNSLRRNERHTYEDFQYIIEVHDDYEKLLRRLKRTNGVVTETYTYIMSVYRELLDKGTFTERDV